MKNWINNKLVGLHLWATEKSAGREEGQGTTEYAVVLGVIVVAIVVAFNTANVGAVIGQLVDRVEALMPAAPAGT